MEISRGDKSQIDSCMIIAKQLKEYFTDKAISKMRNDLQEQMLYIAQDSDQVVGYVSIYIKSPDVAEILWMAVEPKLQNKGFGTALLEYIISDLKHEGIKFIEVKTLSKDIDYLPYELTRKFYEKMGFIHIETIDSYPGWEIGNPCSIFVKKL